MKEDMKRKRSPSPEDVPLPADLGLPEETPLQPDEAAEAIREARRIAGRPSEPESLAEPIPGFSWGPMRPDEKPS
jgi:hypothetical protein